MMIIKNENIFATTKITQYIGLSEYYGLFAKFSITLLSSARLSL